MYQNILFALISQSSPGRTAIVPSSCCSQQAREDLGWPSKGPLFAGQPCCELLVGTRPKSSARKPIPRSLHSTAAWKHLLRLLIWDWRTLIGWGCPDSHQLHGLKPEFKIIFKTRINRIVFFHSSGDQKTGIGVSAVGAPAYGSQGESFRLFLASGCDSWGPSSTTLVSAPVVTWPSPCVSVPTSSSSSYKHTCHTGLT